MAGLPKKQFGLIIKKKGNILPTLSNRSSAAAAFANLDDDDTVDTEVLSSSNASASTMRIRMQAKREHERALAQDPSIFDYDGVYDKLQEKKNEKLTEQKTADKERKSKYAEQILKAHKRRQLEQQSREERQQMKERVAEAGEFDDKEVFVTGAYRQQMEEMQDYREQEAVENRMDDLTAVANQKEGMWQGGFYRTLLNDIARDGTQPTGVEKQETVDEKPIKKEPLESGEAEPVTSSSDQVTSSSKKHSHKLKSLRKRADSSDEDHPHITSSTETKPRITKDNKKSEGKKGKHKEIPKKSIYSDESDAEEPPQTSVQSELKPGLNILPKPVKKPTKAELISSRLTPSPSHTDKSSSDESDRESRGHRRHKERERSRDRISRDQRSGDRRGSRDQRSGDRRGSRDQRSGDRRSRDQRSRDRRGSKDRRGSDEKEKRHHRRGDSRDRRDRDRHEERHRRDSSAKSGKRRERERDDKESRGKEKSDREGKQKEHRNKEREKKEEKIKKEKEKVKPPTKEERLQALKVLLKQRNTEKTIAEFKQRYLERKESGVVTIPI